MRRTLLSLIVTLCAVPVAYGQGTAAAPGKENANPCRDEVAASLQKLRKRSWFRMDSSLITENGPTVMSIDYVLPDKMHQRVTVTTTGAKQETILVGDKAWANEGQGWQILPADITQQLMKQLQENVLSEQSEVGNYSCKGKTKFDGRDVMSYKLEDEGPKEGGSPKNEAFRMFYVDATTGLPVSNAIVTADRLDKPLFKTSYSFPLDISVEPPKDVVAAPPAEVQPAPAATDAAKPAEAPKP